jgi:tRNA pseudouridine synthase 9
MVLHENPTASSAESPGEKTTSSIRKETTEVAEELPAVITTPCDPWPRPYYLENGLRRVKPYHYTYNTWCKQRWRGRELIDVFESEFRDRPVEYYKDAMDSGLVVVNGKAVGSKYVLKNGDLVSHTTHRHEPPVTADPIRVLHEDEDIIVINKPSGVPVHPAGRYHYNSVVEIMKAERGISFVPYPCNRLDRLTSGIMFVAKHPRAAENLTTQISKRTVRKEYIARVIGKFPDGEVVCDQPILVISPKLGLNRIRADGKSARTVFKRLAYYPPAEAESSGDSESSADDDAGRPWRKKKGYSIVRCLPMTGRTHQLRVHLQYLGHPIQNDPIYANQKVWGLDLGYNDLDGTHNTDEDIITRLSRMGKEDVADAVAYHDEMADKYNKRQAELMSGEVCDVCNTALYTDPGEQELSLWLHSLRYEDAGGAWSYSSPLPTWALPPDGVSGPTQVGAMDELVEAVKDVNPEVA